MSASAVIAAIVAAGRLEEEEQAARRKRSAAAPPPTFSSRPQEAFLVEDEEEEAVADQPLYLLNTITPRNCIKCQVVGIRYYRGVAHEGEFVTLEREPQNPYDVNAIRVLNIHGDKVGHVNKEVASVLSPFLDLHPTVVVDALIPQQGTQWSLPLQLELRGPHPSLALPLEEALQRVHVRSQIRKLLREAQFRAQQTSSSTTTTATTVRSTSSGVQQQAPPAAAVAPAVQVESRTLSAKEHATIDLEALFEDRSQAQLQDLPVIDFEGLPLVSKLMPHQQEGIRWMFRQEQGTVLPPFWSEIQEQGTRKWFSELTRASQDKPPMPLQGCLLSDEMGLGKTCQVLGLLLANPPTGRNYSCKSPPPPTVATAIASDKSTITTLVVCPVSVLSNWQAQIEQHVAPNVLRVGLYHGASRYTLQWKDYDVVLTTYHTLAQTYRDDCVTKHSSNNGATTSSLSEHSTNLVVDDDKPAAVPSKSNKNTGSAKKKRKTTSTTAKNPFQVHFHRIVLDEAHVIRNSKSQLCQAIWNLKANHRIALTGTPVTNKVDDLYSLLKFLQVEPLDEKTVFRRALSQPIHEASTEETHDLGMKRLRLLMASMALHRTKSKVPQLELPPKVVELRTVQYAPNCPHRGVYDAIFQSAKQAFRAVLSGTSDDKDGRTKNAPFQHQQSIFEVLTRLRQGCCSGALVPHERLQAAEHVLQIISQSKHKDLTPEEGAKLLEKLKGFLELDEEQKQDEGAAECAVCLEGMDQERAVVLRSCSHVFCATCIGTVLATSQPSSHGGSGGGGVSKCPFCRQSFSKSDLVPYSEAAQAASSSKEGSNNVKPKPKLSEMESLGPSPKMRAILQALQEMKTDEKAVIFSQFTQFLDKLQAFLKEDHGYSLTRIDGSMSATKRIQAMKDFGAEQGGPTVILCSLHACGTGINLTRANHAFLCDTWWNSAVEQQAQDRIHRIGQSRPVRILRFVAADSVETKMMALQEAKATMSKGAFEKLSPEEKRKARMEEVKRLLELD